MVKIGNIKMGKANNTAIIAGPCAIESKDMAFETAGHIKKISQKLSIPFVFKGSFDKANRMSINSKRGIGIDKGLDILAQIREHFSIPVLTDMHESNQAEMISQSVDCIQIPAFLCRQTDLVIAAAETGLPVNIKKGQFISPEDMKFIAGKIESTGNKNVMLTERGTSFGYGDIILDPRSLIIMKNLGYPVILDVTHTTQKPGSAGGKSGGNREFTPYFIRLGMAFNVDAIYLETHPNPAKAISDKENQIPLSDLENILFENFISLK
ncbi:MAG: 3-deoxy-8-phosphooctulonate synthase [Candidatus Zixiibacteriota bacterium]